MLMIKQQSAFKEGDKFFLKNDESRRGKIIRLANYNEFGTDLATWHFNYYVVEMENNASAPIQTNHGGIASDSDIIIIEN